MNTDGQGAQNYKVKIGLLHGSAPPWTKMRRSCELSQDISIMTKYFAYGSNLNMKQMASRTPFATSEGHMYIDNWRLVFRGVADIEPHEGSRLAVGMWKITKPDEDNLDRYEG